MFRRLHCTFRIFFSKLVSIGPAVREEMQPPTPLVSALPRYIESYGTSFETTENKKGTWYCVCLQVLERYHSQHMKNGEITKSCSNSISAAKSMRILVKDSSYTCCNNCNKLGHNALSLSSNVDRWDEQNEKHQKIRIPTGTWEAKESHWTGFIKYSRDFQNIPFHFMKNYQIDKTLAEMEHLTDKCSIDCQAKKMTLDLKIFQDGQTLTALIFLIVFSYLTKDALNNLSNTKIR